jgi:hypothetical protein
MKVLRYLFNVLLVLTIFVSGLGNAAPVAWTPRALSTPVSLEHADCKTTASTLSCDQDRLHAMPVADHVGHHHGGSDHAKAGCCNSFGCPCPASAAILSGLSLDAPVLLDAANVFMFDSNAYISPASKRRIKPPIA